MSLTTNPALVPDRDNLPFKKRDQRGSSPRQNQHQHQKQQQMCDAANFKAPFPYKSHGELRTKPTGLFRPVPRRVPPLYQPWIQTQTPSRPKQHITSAFREHPRWTEWREFNALPPGWDFSHPYQQLNHSSETRALHPGHYPSRFSAGSSVPEGFHRGSGGWERFKTLKDKSLNPDRHVISVHKGPYVRRGDRKTEYLPRAENGSTYLPHTAQHLPKSIKAVSVSGHSLIKVSPDNLNGSSRCPSLISSEQVSSSSAPPNSFPWLLPHFVAGSLIELGDGRLRRVEHLQTEDFLLGSQACPDLRLSCCTVQNISPSSSSSASVSRLLILLHDQQSQELVDVYAEYPFFVRGQGWSSCSPQRTAHLCGLQCRQLTVGDICLALTPISAPECPLSFSQELRTSPKKSQGGCKAQKNSQGQKLGSGEVRRRHYSAP
uniref:AXH domain-containing protein n=1 Tax=Iconisemion striatum TaxID=60296 RepID=A0A1A7Y207_9TELE